ncbi:predicted protein [Sparassis crispa]|uniref:Rho-GAP domain-containing protein n=1 Tax=Sparassis crispa TaxID=139825 RepID=A0A401GWM6_9APHY|nr:predicted protein [Sparassis crispa]GBE86582.1 predicted protein [Sparassis crispa]
MAVLSLPLTFQNSFWSQDYRTGLEVLYTQLENGVAENAEIVAFIKARAIAESGLATALANPVSKGSAFAQEDGVSLHLAFRGLQEESVAQGKAHELLAKELRTSVAEPFEKWATGYKERLRASKGNVLEHWMLAYEFAQGDVGKLKDDYHTKTRRADEAEDDVRFAPVTQPPGDKYTISPSLVPKDVRPRRMPQRQPTVTERISARFKEFRLGTTTAPHTDDAQPEVQFDADTEEKEKSTPRVDKGKGRAIEGAVSPPSIASPPPLSPPLPKLVTDPVPPAPAPPMILAGISVPPADVSALLKRAKEELPLRAVRFPLLGEYQECFSGEEFATWLKENVESFGGDLDRAAFAARELTEKYKLLRRLGELGNDFENAPDAIYQFRSKAFDLGSVAVPAKPEQALSSPQKALSPLAEEAKRTTASFASLVSRALNTNQNGNEPSHVKLRRDAEVADREYRIAIRKLDRQRLALEERIEDTLKTLQRWELDRLRAVKTVLRQYHDAVALFAKAYEPSLERSDTLIAAYQPEADIKALIEQHRTGPFRPTPQVYESVAHDESDVVFGLDLRRWADSGYWHASPTAGEEKRDEVPPVLTLLLAALNEAYPKLSSDIEKRKTWIYDVPLPGVHHLRETLNAVPPEQPLPNDVLGKYDAPVLASAVKLWALELDPPLGMFEGWDEFRKLYPTVGSYKADESPSNEQHILDVQIALQKLPKIHLLVLDTIIKHLKDLIDSTAEANGEDAREVYVTKLALTMGRTVLRPRQENEFSIQDRHPTLLFIDLLNKYAEILPPTILKKKRESERKVPVRRRTRPVDMRLSRSRISAGADLKELHAQQLAQRTGLKNAGSPPAVPAANIPILPQVAESPLPQKTEHDAPAVMLSAGPDSFDELPPAPPAHDAKEERVDFASIPPPPPLQAPIPKTPVIPPHPMFREPPPETDDAPPRPTFKEPAPEPASPEPPMPSFVEPPREFVTPPVPQPSFVDPPVEPEQSTRTPTAIPAVLRSGGSGSTSRPVSPRTSSLGSRSPSPTKPSTSPTLSQDRPVRGGRLTRGPRAPGGGGAVSSMVSNLNRQSIGARPASPANGGSGSSLSRPGSRTYTGHGKRSSISRVAEFSRRTMASDAEDEVVDK